LISIHKNTHYQRDRKDT